MAFNLNDFKSRGIPEAGFRPTLFEISNTGRVGEQFKFLCMATNVPAFTVGVIEVPYFGRKIKVPGDRTYTEWTTTVMLDESFDIRDQLEAWNLSMNSYIENVGNVVNGSTGPKDNLAITLYGKAGNAVRSYTLESCWPIEVGPIDLDWNATDTIGTFQVTWAFDFMDIGA